MLRVVPRRPTSESARARARRAAPRAGCGGRPPQDYLDGFVALGLALLLLKPLHDGAGQRQEGVVDAAAVLGGSLVEAQPQALCRPGR